MVDRIRDLGATVMVIPAPAALPELISRIARLWAELHEADPELAMELVRKLPETQIERAYR